MDFHIEVSFQKGSPTVSITGEVDLCTAPQFEERLRALIADGNDSICIDLTGCTYFDSEGIYALVRAYKALGPGGELAICKAGPSVLRVLQISGLDRVLTICDTETIQ